MPQETLVMTNGWMGSEQEHMALATFWALARIIYNPKASPALSVLLISNENWHKGVSAAD